jgi:SAM-dependent methyltransferase
MRTPEQFYDDLAADYDAMTRFASRLKAQTAMLRPLLQRLPARRVADMGCGTGVHAVALALLGCEVTGVDLSAEMLARARAHAVRNDAAVRFIHGDFLTPLDTQADLILCLGNSLPHLASNADLLRVLSHWRELVAPGGRLLLQMLNYRRILDRRERIVNIRRDDDRSIIRFYDFLDDALQFNILTIDGNTPPGHDLRSTRLMPFTDTELSAAAQQAGWSNIELYGKLDFSDYDADSADCVLVAS